MFYLHMHIASTACGKFLIIIISLLRLCTLRILYFRNHFFSFKFSSNWNKANDFVCISCSFLFSVCCCGYSFRFTCMCCVFIYICIAIDHVQFKWLMSNFFFQIHISVSLHTIILYSSKEETVNHLFYNCNNSTLVVYFHHLLN